MRRVTPEEFAEARLRRLARLEAQATLPRAFVEGAKGGTAGGVATDGTRWARGLVNITTLNGFYVDAGERDY